MIYLYTGALGQWLISAIDKNIEAITNHQSLLVNYEIHELFFSGYITFL